LVLAAVIVAGVLPVWPKDVRLHPENDEGPGSGKTG
jgi:hypothetical protein